MNTIALSSNWLDFANRAARLVRRNRKAKKNEEEIQNIVEIVDGKG
jgi:hypothetical protein